MKIYTNDLVKGHSDFKVKCLTFGLYTQVSDSGPLGPLVFFSLGFHAQNICHLDFSCRINLYISHLCHMCSCVGRKFLIKIFVQMYVVSSS